MYFTAKGGSTAWDTERYLNIWIADTGDAIAGLGSAPGQRDRYEDGVVVYSKLFNQDNPCRTLTHEIGHYLGLFHMWNADSTCEDRDFVEDTPVQAYPYYDCPKTERITCGSPDMYMNFMDYTDPDCMFFFTRGQTSRMEQILLQFRSGILHTKTECSPQEKISDYLVYPNPISSGSINLRFENDEPVYLYIEVFDMHGKLLYSQHCWKKEEIRLDLKGIRLGVYVLVVNGVVKKVVMV